MHEWETRMLLKHYLKRGVGWKTCPSTIAANFARGGLLVREGLPRTLRNICVSLVSCVTNAFNHGAGHPALSSATIY